MPDPIFAHPRLAAIYDDLDGDRRDLEHYEAMVIELGATSVLDLGCGTGTFACRLALSGYAVIGVDPAEASLKVARGKPGADRVSWILREVTTLPLSTRRVDLVTMTGNVAQVFVDDDSWTATLRATHAALRRGGHLVFESRNPAFESWKEWTKAASSTVTSTAFGSVESWVELIDLALPRVSFRWSYRFVIDGIELTSDSTLRFRTLDELVASVTAAGFTVDAVRDAPDRPGREFVIIATRAD